MEIIYQKIRLFAELLFVLLDLKFDNVILEKVPSEVVSALIDENRYGINLTMLKRIVKFLNPELAAGVESRPYSTLN